MRLVGKVLASWGEGMFLMPHMVTIDQWGFVWLTDVGLHQVFKFDPAGHLLLTLGQRLQPGGGASFCKPTQVGCDHAISAHPGIVTCALAIAQRQSRHAAARRCKFVFTSGPQARVKVGVHVYSRGSGVTLASLQVLPCRPVLVPCRWLSQTMGRSS